MTLQMISSSLLPVDINFSSCMMVYLTIYVNFREF